MMLPILISVSVAPVSYFFCASAPLVVAANRANTLETIANRVALTGIPFLPLPLPMCRCYGASGEGMAPSAPIQLLPMELPMSQHCHFDASRSLTALEQDSTIIAVIEMSQTKWLVAALIPGVERQPLKKFDAHEETLLKLLHRWRREAGQAGRNIKRIVVAFEAGRDGFWLARWLRARDIEVYVIHPTKHCRVARTPAR